MSRFKIPNVVISIGVFHRSIVRGWFKKKEVENYERVTDDGNRRRRARGATDDG